MAGDETAATGGVMFTDEGELEFDEDEMAVLEGRNCFRIPDLSRTSKASTANRMNYTGRQLNT